MNTPISTQKATSLIDLLKIARRGWIGILLGAALGTSLGYLAVRWMHPKYQVNLMIQVDTQARRPSGSLGEMSELFQTDSKAETETEIVQSNTVIGNVVDKFGLENGWSNQGVIRRLMHKEGRLDIAKLRLPPIDPALKKTWSLVAVDSDHFVLLDIRKQIMGKGQVGALTRIVVNRNDTAEILVSRMEAEPGESFLLFKIPRPVAINFLKSQLKVMEKGRRTDLLAVTYTNQYPDKARDILNSLATTYVQQNIDIRSAEAHKTMEFLQQQLPLVKERLDSMENILNAYRYSKGTVDIGTEARVYLDEKSRLQQQLLALNQQRQELLRLYREDHPSVVAVDAQKRQIESALAGSDRQVKSLPLTQQQIQKLSRDVEVNTTIYTTLLNNIQQLQVVQGGEVGNARIVDFADLPAGPSGPSSSVVVLVGLIFGTAMGFGALLAIKSMRNGVSDPWELESTGVPVLSQIPESSRERSHRKTAAKRPLLALSNPDDVTVEAIRSLRTALNITLPSQPHPIIAVSGLTANVGKSFVCSNLGALYAQLGKRVVVVDADLRKGRLHEQFDVSEAGGLTDVLSGKLDPVAAARATSVAGLSVISKGSISNRPGELLEQSSFKTVLDRLAEAFDLVLVDTSPLLLTSESLLVLKNATHTLLVLESGSHTVETINDGIRKMVQCQIDGVSFVLNQCDLGDTGYRNYGVYAKN